MGCTCVDAHLQKLLRIERCVRCICFRRGFIDGWEDWYSDVLGQLQVWKPELRLLQMFLRCFATWDGTDCRASKTDPRFLKGFFCCFARSGTDAVEMRATNLRSMLTTIEGIWGWSLAIPFLEITLPSKENWDRFASKMVGAVLQCRPLIEQMCGMLLNYSLKCKRLASDEMLQFLAVVLEGLKDLVRYKADKIVPLKKQIEILEGRLILLRNFFELTSHGCIDSTGLREFKVWVHAFASNAACLISMLWMKVDDEEITAEMYPFDVLQKTIKPCEPDVMALYFEAIKAIKLQRSDDTLLLGQVVANIVELLLENLMAPLENDIQVLREGLIFLLAFRADPPEDSGQHGELILIRNQIDVLLRKGLYLILPLDYMKEDLAKEKICLSDFVTKIESTKSKIIQRFVLIPFSSFHYFPKTNALGFFYFLLQNLENLKDKLDSKTMSIPFAKYYIIKIEKELATLMPFLNDILELQKESREAQGTWSEVINLAYLTERVVNMCFINLNPVWYCMSCLSYVLDKVMLVKEKVVKIKDCNKHYSVDPSYSVGYVAMPLEQVRYSRTSEEVVGFELEADVIIGKLRWGFKSLDIISIVGMAGIGKTTLARKVFNAPTVRYHFNIRAFCTASQVHDTRNLYLDILRDIIVIDENIHSMTEQDLAHLLWKCLNGQRYLIVMDDLWDIRAWEEVRSSFPDNQNGSRVIFTTRSRKVALEAKSSLYPLHLLCDDKSWGLLKKKVFGNDDCPEILAEVGKLIAKNCKGLALAIVVIAGVLAKTGRSLSSWNKIAKATCSYAFEEGCKDILELSYKHLPEHLKSCFLYFGAFAKDDLIYAKRLMMLWIGEGFVLESKTKSSENVANECLSDLVDRSLVIASKRSSRGGIKICRIHDVIHDFCQKKAEEENFFRLIQGTAPSNSSNYTMYDSYRVSIQMIWKSFDEAEPVSPYTHSLLYCHGWDTGDCYECNLRSLKLVQVLHLEKIVLDARLFHAITSLVNLKYVAVSIHDLPSIPSSISNLYNLETFVLTRVDGYGTSVSLLLPGTIWKMKRLGCVDVGSCRFDLNGDLDEDEAYAEEEDTYSVLDNVRRFSSLTLSSRSATELPLKEHSTCPQFSSLLLPVDVTLKRLPNVRELSCRLDESWDSRSNCNRLLPLDFLSKLESLKLYSDCYQNPPVIFPLTLRKLSLSGFGPSWSGFSAIGKLPCLEVLKILDHSEPRWEMEDAEFPNLKFLKLMELDLEKWNASIDSFPCLEQLVLKFCKYLDEIPACIGEISTLRSIEVHMCNNKVAASAVQIQKDQMDLGNELELMVSNYFEE